jgi:hypothetical protein
VAWEARLWKGSDVVETKWLLGHTYLAEGWSFWLLHIAPYALDRVLPVEYYTHLLDLVAIMK